MAIAKTARVVASEHTAGGTCVIELAASEPLGFAGGQYIIVDSGLTLPTGKAAKRAYSIFSSDTDQGRFRLAVKRIPDGVVSGFMHGLTPGAVVPFSGPWGKLGPIAGDTAAGATLVLATDTGISAALGLVQGARMRPLLPTTTLIWLQVDGDDFLPEARVRAQIPAGCAAVRLAALPPIGHPERVPHVRALVAAELARPAGLARAFISGDGAVNYAVLDDLVAAGVPATRDSVESFFNMPKKSA
jgi:ferredoxin-NADP reductase